MINLLLYPYVYTCFLTCLATLAIGFFVYLKKRRSAVHRTFLIFCLSIAQWSFFTALHVMPEDPAWALFWSRVCHAGALLIPVFFYYFTLKIIGRPRRFPLITGFGLAAILFLLNFTTRFFTGGVRNDVGPHYFTKAGPLYFVLIAFFCFYVLLGLIDLWKEIRLSAGTRKKHLQYFFWSSLLGFTIGIVNFSPVYGLKIPPYPYSAACGALYAGLIAYAILKHRLFDIELIVKKTLVFTILFGSVYAAVSAVIFFAGYFVAKTPLPLLPAISIGLAMILYEPLKGFLTGLTNRFLFQKKIAYTTLIQRLTDRLSSLRETQTLSDEIVDFVHQEMALDWAAFYLRDNGDSLFNRSSSKGMLLDEELRESGTLESHFDQRKAPLILNPFDVEGDLESQAKATLRGQQIEALVPVYLENKLHGILLLGKKKSDDAFNREDEALLGTLMEEASMLFLSGKLLREAVRSNLEVGQRLKMTALIKLARGVHHEVRNPLHSLALFASATLQDLREGRHRTVPVDDVVTKLRQRVQSMLEEIGRISDSLSRFAQFARPGEDLALKNLVLRREIDKFLALMEEGQKLDQIEVRVSVPESIEVLASAGALQEVLFNLFNNAYEAMRGQGKLFLDASEDGQFVELTIRDTGPGIPEGILPNIFDAYFTTKTDSEAAGIGLSITKHRLEQMGGSIEGAPAAEGGALFTIRLRRPLS